MWAAFFAITLEFTLMEILLVKQKIKHESVNGIDIELSEEFNQENLEVYLNGIRLFPDIDYSHDLSSSRIIFNSELNESIALIVRYVDRETIDSSLIDCGTFDMVSNVKLEANEW